MSASEEVDSTVSDSAVWDKPVSGGKHEQEFAQDYDVNAELDIEEREDIYTAALVQATSGVSVRMLRNAAIREPVLSFNFQLEILNVDMCTLDEATEDIITAGMAAHSNTIVCPTHFKLGFFQKKKVFTFTEKSWERFTKKLDVITDNHSLTFAAVLKETMLFEEADCRKCALYDRSKKDVILASRKERTDKLMKKEAKVLEDSESSFKKSSRERMRARRKRVIEASNVAIRKIKADNPKLDYQQCKLLADAKLPKEKLGYKELADATEFRKPVSTMVFKTEPTESAQRGFNFMAPALSEVSNSAEVPSSSERTAKKRKRSETDDDIDAQIAALQAKKAKKAKLNESTE